MPKAQVKRVPVIDPETNTFVPKHKLYPHNNGLQNIKDLVKTPTQAEVIISKFGGPMELYRTLKAMYPKDHWSYTSIYRWLYPRGKKRGTGGIIPTHAIISITRAARLHGFFLDYKDFFPESQTRMQEITE